MDNFEQDLQSIQALSDYAKQIKQAGIHSYDDLFNLIRDENAGLDLRQSACLVLGQMRGNWRKFSVDRRRALSPLLAALKSPDEVLRSRAALAAGMIGNKRAFTVLLNLTLHDPASCVRLYAIQALGFLRDKRAVEPLLTIAQDKNADHRQRIFAIIALTELDDQSVIPGLRAIMLDQTDVDAVRAEAAEWVSHMAVNADLIPDYVMLLNNESVQLRFWAAFGLVTMSRDNKDISGALPAIDRIVAYDTDVLWGWWHVSREAVPALEKIWFQRCANQEGCGRWTRTYLISPLLEYDDYRRESYHVINEETHFIPFEQHTDLKLDPEWLRNQIVAQWPDAQINIRQSEALILDWLIEMENGQVLGGLHRDEYCLFLTGDEEDVATFALWYRQIIAPEHTLRLYDWADPGRETRAGMTPHALLINYHDRS